MILVLDGDTRSALAVTRSLGNGGYEVVVASSSHRSLAGCSRHCDERLVYPDPYESASQFEAWILEVARQERFGLVIPISDLTTHICVGLEGRLPAAKLVLPRKASFIAAVDKFALVQAARGVGLDAPESILLSPDSDLKTLPSKLGWPIVLKPRFSIETSGDGFARREVCIVRSELELEQRVASMLPAGDIIAQEFVCGRGTGVFALLKDNEVLATFAHRRVREKPPGGGVSVLSESIAPPAPLADRSIELLKKLKWHGVAMVEFRSSQNKDYLMEVNARFWGSLQLAILAGVDFPRLLAEMTERNTHVEPTHYRIGVRNRWLIGDFDRLLILIFRDKSGLTAVEKWQQLLQFLNLSKRKQYFEVLQVRDLGPFLHELRSWLAALLPWRGRVDA